MLLNNDLILLRVGHHQSLNLEPPAEQQEARKSHGGPENLGLPRRPKLIDQIAVSIQEPRLEVVYYFSL